MSAEHQPSPIPLQFYRTELWPEKKVAPGMRGYKTPHDQQLSQAYFWRHIFPLKCWFLTATAFWVQSPHHPTVSFSRFQNYSWRLKTSVYSVAINIPSEVMVFFFFSKELKFNVLNFLQLHTCWRAVSEISHPSMFRVWASGCRICNSTMAKS